MRFKAKKTLKIINSSERTNKCEFSRPSREAPRIYQMEGAGEEGEHQIRWDFCILKIDNLGNKFRKKVRKTTENYNNF